MDASTKINVMHIITAIIASIVSAIFLIPSNFKILGVIPGMGNNLLISAGMGLLILYITGRLTDQKFGDEETKGMKNWLWNGIVPFIFVWFVVTTLLYNYSGYPISLI
ncbi:MAG: hypothetical protein ACRCVG_00370 [Methanobacteriaceae archaeon]